MDLFAKSYSLTKDLNSLQKICKGKWLLEVFCQELYKELSEFKKHCGLHDNKKCQFCEIGSNMKCLYRLQDGIGHVAIYSLSKKLITIPDLNYIRSAIRKLCKKM